MRFFQISQALLLKSCSLSETSLAKIQCCAFAAPLFRGFRSPQRDAADFT
jgi:hypothetical protein